MKKFDDAGARRAFLSATLALGISLLLPVFSTPASADEWPTKPVTIVVPYGPGAVNDLYARAAASLLTKKFNQPFVVENRAGAGSYSGSSYVSRSAPDGYTLLENSNAITGLGQGAASINFDARKDLTAIAVLAGAPQAFLVSTESGIKSIPEFIAYAKAHPDQTFYGIAGFGNFQHLKTEEFNILAGIKAKAAVYNSGAPIMTDLAAGRIHMTFGSVNSALGLIQSGKIAILAYTDSGTTADAPKAPTIKEAGVDFSYRSWWSIFAPPGMAPDLRDKINAAFRAVTQDPEFVELIGKAGATPLPLSATEFAAVLNNDMNAVNELIKKTGISPQ